MQLSDSIPRKVVRVVTYCNSVIKIITLKKGKAILPQQTRLVKANVGGKKKFMNDY